MIEIKLSFNTRAEALAFLAESPASAAPAPKGKTKEAAPPAAESEAQKPAGPKREDVSAKVVMLATKSVDAATAVLSKFGVAKARELKDEDLAEALKATEAALAQLDMA